MFHYFIHRQCLLNMLLLESRVARVRDSASHHQLSTFKQCLQLFNGIRNSDLKKYININLSVKNGHFNE